MRLTEGPGPAQTEPGGLQPEINVTDWMRPYADAEVPGHSAEEPPTAGGPQSIWVTTRRSAAGG